MPVIGVAELLVVPTFSGLQSKVGQQVDAAVKATPTAGAQAAGSRLGGFLTDSLSTATGIGLAKAGELAMSQVSSIFTTGFKRLADIDTAKAKMRGLGFTVEEVDSLMASALTSVKGTPYGLGEAATAAAAAVASGIQPGEDMDRVLGAIAESAAAAGTPLTEMADLYLDVAAKGKAQNDVLGRVAERGIPIYQELAEMLGVTKDEVFKLGTAGKIDFATFEKAMINASGNVAREMGQTLPGAWMNFQAAVSRVGANLMGGIYPMMVQGVLGVTKAMAPLEATARIVGDGFVALLTRAGAVWTGLATLFASGSVSQQLLTALGVGPDSPIIAGLLWVRDTAMAMGAGVQAAVAAAAGWATQHAGVFQFLGSILGGAVAAWAGLQGVMGAVSVVAGALSGAFGLVVSVVLKVWSGLQSLYLLMLTNPIGAVIVAVGALVGGLIYLYRTNEQVRAVIQAAWTGIQAAVMTAWTGYIQPALQAFGSFLTTVVGPALLAFWQGVVVPAFTAIGAVISSAWTGVILPVFSALVSWVQGTLAPIFVALWQQHIVPAFAGIVAAVQQAWTAIGPALIQIGAQAMSLATTVGTVLVGAFNVLWPIIQQVANFLGPILGAAINMAVGFIGLLVGSLVTHLGGAIQAAIGLIQGLVTFVAAVFRGDWAAAWNSLVDIVKNAFQLVWHTVNVILTVNVLGAVRGGLMAILNLARGSLSGLGGIFAGAWNLIVGIVRGAWTGIVSIVRGGATGLVNISRGLANGITSLFQSMGAGMGRIMSGAWSAVRGFFTSGVNAARGLVSQLVAAVTGFFRNLASNMSSIISSAWSVVRSLFSGGATAARGLVSQLVAAVTGFFRNLASVMRSVVAGAWSTVRSLFSSGTSAIRDLVSRMVTAVTGFFRNLASSILNHARTAMTNARTQFTNGLNALRNTVSSGIDRVLGFFRDLPGRIKGALGNLGGVLVQSGRDIINGLLVGAGEILPKIGAFFLDKLPGWIREPFKQAMGIHSPSRVFAQFGKDTVEGYAIGVAKHAGTAADSVADMADDAIAAAAALSTDLTGSVALADLVRGPGGVLPPALAMAFPAPPGGLASQPSPLAPTVQQGRGVPSYMTVRIGEQEFTAYVESIGDARLAQHVAGLSQPIQQTAGAL